MPSPGRSLKGFFWKLRNIIHPWRLSIVLALALSGATDFALAQRPFGIDVSSYQGSADNPPTNINWTLVKNSGTNAFAWAKATEGLTYIDADFAYNVTHAKSAGVPIGAYHFAHPDTHPGTSGADSEAAYFWSTAGQYIIADGKSLQPMLDAEVANPGTQTAVSQWVNEWCQDIVNYGLSNGVVLKPVVYTYQSWASSYLNNTVTNWPLWMAASLNGQSAQTGAPATLGPWSTWAIWQYGGGPIPGIEGTCDVDVFNGTLASFNSSMFVFPNAPTITSLSTNVTIWQGSNAIFSVTASNALTYQWTLNHTNIPSATATSYAINNAQLSNAGAYNVVVSNAHAGTISPTVFLSVLGPLTNAPGAIVAPTNMVDWWPADGNANDIYGTANGTPFGGFYYSPGHSGEAFHFDGSSGYVSTGAASISPPWTASMWVNYSHTSQPAASLLEDGSFALRLEQKGSGTHNVGISQNNYTDSVFSYAAPTGTWVHLAFVGTTSNVTLYANGVNEGSINTNNMPLPRAYIGAGYNASSAANDNYMLGNLDDVMIFGRALASNEIDSIYNAGSASLVRAPYITGGVATTNGHFNLNLEGMTGKNYTLYVTTNMLSTNVSTWINLGLLANPNGTNTYVVPNIYKYQQIYFRVSQPY
ncbi:MAG TPA: GH25 family lysozyme [Verrucomicrobiae bacterium]|nr:GH25 family lysozyme [Verrucomicrobiae bacterium]